MTSESSKRLLLVLFSSYALVGVLIGCGGGQSGLSTSPPANPGAPAPSSLVLPASGPATAGSRASAVFRIEWPPLTNASGGSNQSAVQPRLIPTAAMSIKVEITMLDSRGSTVAVATKILNRPESVITFDRLPAGSLLVAATAYPGINAGGVPQAQVQKVPLTTVVGSRASVTATMLTTIKRIDVQPAGPSVAKNSTVVLTAVPRDAANRIVLVAPAKLRWSTANAGIAAVTNVNGSGVYKGIQEGRVQVKVTDVESAKFGEATLTVTAEACTVRDCPTPQPSPTPVPSPTPAPTAAPTATPGGFCPPYAIYNCGETNPCPSGKCQNCETGACEEPLVH